MQEEKVKRLYLVKTRVGREEAMEDLLIVGHLTVHWSGYCNGTVLAFGSGGEVGLFSFWWKLESSDAR